MHASPAATGAQGGDLSLHTDRRTIVEPIREGRCRGCGEPIAQVAIEGTLELVAPDLKGHVERIAAVSSRLAHAEEELAERLPSPSAIR